jgi:apolipoprotein N-acyltransferase
MSVAPRILSPAAAPGLSRPPATRLPPWAWLLLGAVLMALSGMRFGVAALAWIAPVPWLIYLRQTSGWRSRLGFAVVVQLALLLQIAKIVTAPIPFAAAPMFSVPMALGATVLFIAFEAWRRRLGDGWGLVLFPALAVLSEWVSASGSELGSWGASAYTQIDNLPLLQTASIFGLAGIGWLMAQAAAVIAVGLAAPRQRGWRPVGLVTAVLFIVAQLWGAVRLSTDLEGPEVLVAGVVSDIGMDGGLPSPDAVATGTDALFARSEAAASAGAALVVWNEGATLVEHADEAGFLARGQAMSAATGADLVLAYVVPLDGMRRFENKYVWMTPTGAEQTYLKHHPVPGEGSVAGTAPFEVRSRPYGQVGGAICYDFDFPALGMAYAELGAGLMVVPSSDWKGIDPYHTQMAAIRGIEGGYSVLRPVRWATSGAYDPMGRPRGTMSWFEDDERVLLARLPTTRIDTLYSRVGDVIPALGGVFVLLGLLALVRRRFGRGTSDPHPAEGMVESAA